MLDIIKIKNCVFLRQQARIEHSEKLKNRVKRIQSLKLQALDQLEKNPLSAPAILDSEIGTDADIQQTIAELIKNNNEVFKKIVNSPKNLWEISYPITTAITLKATYNTELAIILGNVLEDDNPIKITLRMVGRLK